ncbi:hypothetical protein WMY93_026138 [Mugilogobius chulae]|uniref:THAP-type domain-containing protein n=1 Tax=Mugilogobius chulae TaxID=88201 RepID=A0AAW0MWM5_9GOBI
MPECSLGLSKCTEHQNKIRGNYFSQLFFGTLRFSKDREFRRKWERATKRDRFIASDSSVLCSTHFMEGDMDRTGQCVRVRQGIIPSVFSFPPHLQSNVVRRSTQTSKRAEEKLDHDYSMRSPKTLKRRLTEAVEHLETIKRQKKNVRARELTAKMTVSQLILSKKGHTYTKDVSLYISMDRRHMLF